MTIRFSFEEAIRRGWIKREEVPPEAGTGANPPAPAAPASPRRQYTSDLPQERLFRLLKARWGDRVVSEFEGAVPGRRFRIDVAIPDAMVACECDGYRYHKSLKSFINDRARGRLLVIHGWKLLHFPVNTIFKEPDVVLRDVGALVHDLPSDPNGSINDEGESEREELLRYLNT